MIVRNQFRCNSCGGVYTDVCSDGTVYNHVCGPLSFDPKGAETERPNARDENIGATLSGVLLGIVSEGLGVTCLTNGALTEPPWITRLNAAAAAQGE